ncbi:hypothetical protein [Bradyrhizobium sp. HKCCYLS20291]|uniref:hypothetical protein n=1 Tax=Bradyrhizobium sp. HKCCYLS20291 TaxID=3420766 RepID=UPI003EB82A5D
MINHEAGRQRLSGENGRFAALDGNTLLDHGETHERFPRHRLHLPRDYELAIRWLRPSFLNRDDQDARPAGRERDFLPWLPACGPSSGVGTRCASP